MKRMYDGWASLWFWPVISKTDITDVPLPENFESLQWVLFNGRKSGEELGIKYTEWFDTVGDIARREIFFHWEIEFPEVFEKDRAGFDAVFGNPPYVRQEKLKNYKGFFTSLYETSSGTSDLFVYFYEKGLKILRQSGYLGLISSNTYMKTGSGIGLRKFLKHEILIKEIIDFGDLQIFKKVTTYPSIAIIKKLKPDLCHKVNYMELKDLTIKDLSLLLNTSSIFMPQFDLDDSSWSFEDKRLKRLREKIMNQGVSLISYCSSIFRGIVTGFNEAFIIDEQIKKDLIQVDNKSSDIIKPFLEGKDIKSWHIDHTNKWIIFARRGIEIDNYPAIKNYLLNFREKLEPRPDNWDDKKQGKWKGRKSGSYKWFEIQDNIAYYELFEKPKIIYPMFQNRPKFYIDVFGYYTNQNAFIITVEDYYLLGILNSKCFWFQIMGKCASLRGGNWRYILQKNYFENLVIPEPLDNIKKQLADLAKQIQENFQIQKDSKDLINDLNFLTYQAYNLNEDEIKLIEKETSYLNL